MKFKKIELPIISFYIVLILLGSLLVLTFILFKTNKSLETIPVEKDLTSNLLGYRFISPLLDCADNTINQTETRNLKAEVEDVIETNIDKANIKSASVYFRDLNNGPWIAYNTEEKFSPASLMKVPLLIAYLKRAETDKGFLDQKINSGSTMTEIEQNMKPRLKIEQNTSYSVMELLEILIIHSDNVAGEVLLKNLKSYELEFVYSDLGLDFQGWVGGENFLTVKDYSSFFRILYNASYLNREMSELALSILARSEYDAGIKAGISDKNIVIAHKFGERNFAGIKQLHDCGIIYNYNKPYLLCIMTRGEDFSVMKNVIKEISEIVYQNLKVK